MHRANFIRQTSDWDYIAHRLFPLLPHFTHSLSPFRYVYACARGCVRFSQHTRIQRRQDLFAFNRYRVILIDKIMYFAIFCTCHVISTRKVSQTCLTVCIHARTLPTVILNCHSQKHTIAKSSRTTPIWLLFSVACGKQS